jgi:ubiquitin-protein ligase
MLHVDIADKNTGRVPGINAVPHEDNLRYFDVTIHGPSQSPYEGAKLLETLSHFPFWLNCLQGEYSNWSSSYPTTTQ